MSTTNEKTRRRRTASEEGTILEEARAPNTTVAEVLRRHQLDAATNYRREREAKAAVLAALGDHPRTVPDALARENARLRVELAKNRRIIAEVVDENLGLKGGSKGAGLDALLSRGEGGAAHDAHAAHDDADPDRVDDAAHLAPSGADERAVSGLDQTPADRHAGRPTVTAAAGRRYPASQARRGAGLRARPSQERNSTDLSG